MRAVAPSHQHRANGCADPKKSCTPHRHIDHLDAARLHDGEQQQLFANQAPNTMRENAVALGIAAAEAGIKAKSATSGKLIKFKIRDRFSWEEQSERELNS